MQPLTRLVALATGILPNVLTVLPPSLRDLIPQSGAVVQRSELDKMVASSGKMLLLHKLLPKLKAEGHKVLIFSQFVIMLNVLEDYLTLAGHNVERIDGSTAGTARQVNPAPSPLSRPPPGGAMKLRLRPSLSAWSTDSNLRRCFPNVLAGRHRPLLQG